MTRDASRGARRNRRVGANRGRDHRLMGTPARAS